MARILRGAGGVDLTAVLLETDDQHRVKGRTALLPPISRDAPARSSHLIGGCWISLLKSQAFLTLKGRANVFLVIDFEKH
jgi:hypothetical protein